MLDMRAWLLGNDVTACGNGAQGLARAQTSTAVRIVNINYLGKYTKHLDERYLNVVDDKGAHIHLDHNDFRNFISIGKGALDAIRMPRMGKFPKDWLHDFYKPADKGKPDWMFCSRLDDGVGIFVYNYRSNPLPTAVDVQRPHCAPTRSRARVARHSPLSRSVASAMASRACSRYAPADRFWMLIWQRTATCKSREVPMQGMHARWHVAA